MLRAMCRRASYLHDSRRSGKPWDRQRISGKVRRKFMSVPCENLQVARHGFDAAIEVRQVELLVGRVQVVVGESETHHDAGDPQVAVEDADDGDGTAAADVDRLLAELFLERSEERRVG